MEKDPHPALRRNLELYRRRRRYCKVIWPISVFPPMNPFAIGFIAPRVGMPILTNNRQSASGIRSAMLVRMYMPLGRATASRVGPRAWRSPVGLARWQTSRRPASTRCPSACRTIFRSVSRCALIRQLVRHLERVLFSGNRGRVAPRCLIPYGRSSPAFQLSHARSDRPSAC